MKSEIMTFDELLESWDEENGFVEEVICEATGEIWPGEWSQEIFDLLNAKYGNRKFEITPYHEHVHFRGKVNSDFRVTLAVEQNQTKAPLIAPEQIVFTVAEAREAENGTGVGMGM